jgi:hypothetical protein
MSKGVIPIGQQRMLIIPANNSVRARSDHAIHGLLTGGSSNAVSSEVRKKVRSNSYRFSKR